jgi:hypothetical protein
VAEHVKSDLQNSTPGNFHHKEGSLAAQRFCQKQPGGGGIPPPPGVVWASKRTVNQKQ